MQKDGKVCVFFFFFFKQKTAYEILTCDWSSDVCSSDLLKMSANMDEVRSVLQKVEEEMARARSKDTGGVDGQSYLCSYITHFYVCKVTLYN